MYASLALLCLSLQGPPLCLDDLATRYQVAFEAIKSPLKWKGDGYTVEMEPAADAKLEKYLSLFEKEWSRHAVELVRRARVKRVVIGRGLKMNGQERAAVPAFDGDTMYYDAELGDYSPSYQRVVIHHEFFHMVDQRMKLLRRDPEWSALNPPEFKYGSGGDKLRTLGVGELTDKIPGFLTPYGASAVEEDKAELFAHLLVNRNYVMTRAGTDSVLARKIALLQSRLSNFIAKDATETSIPFSYHVGRSQLGQSSERRFSRVQGRRTSPPLRSDQARPNLGRIVRTARSLVRIGLH